MPSNNDDTNTITSQKKARDSSTTLSTSNSRRSIEHTTVDIEKAASIVEKNIDEEKSKSQPLTPPPTRSLIEKIIRRTRFVVLLFGLLMGMFMVSLNTTVVAPAMNIIATELDSIENQTWIATGYLVAMNAFQALAGKFSDVFGRKPIVLFGMFFFTMGSLINALTPTMNGLIAGRVVQGFGAGAIISMLFVIISDIAPLHLRPRFQAVLSVIYGLSSVIGPLIGGAFVDKLTWRWDFWLNVILGGFSITVTTFLFSEPADIPKSSFWSKMKRVDWYGTIFAMSFVCCLLLGLNWGSGLGWRDPHSYGSFLGAAVSLAGLIIAEGWIAREPLMPKEVVLNPAILTVYIYVMCLGLSFIGTLYFGPVLYQSVFGASSTASGIRLIPYMVLLIAGSIGSSFLIGKYVPYMKYFLVVAAASNLLGYGLFYTVDENSNWGQQAGYLVFCGFAFGLSQQNAILSVQKIAAKEYIAVATTLLNFFMMLASSVGIAIFQTLFQLFLTNQFSHVNPEILAVAEEYGALRNYLYVRDLPENVHGPIVQCYMAALRTVFILPLVAAGLGFVATLFIKKMKFLGRHRTEGKEEKSMVTQDDKASSETETASVDIEAGELTTRTLTTSVIITKDTQNISDHQSSKHAQ